MTNILATADLAARIGLGLVTYHAGFLPHEESDPEFAKFFSRIADLFPEKNIALALDTGQETAKSRRIAGLPRPLKSIFSGPKRARQ